MLGRGVAERLGEVPPDNLVHPEVVEFASRADLFLLNLECCISERGEPWPDPGKPFFFRAPPAAVETLAALGVDVVTLANNHALDYDEVALLDTLRFLEQAGIEHVGAGADELAARSPVALERRGVRVAIFGVSDHPPEFDAARGAPGIAYADLLGEVPAWLREGLRRATEEVVLVTPHWGPNMTAAPVPHVRAAARALLEAGTTLVAGHSAHVFHGVEGRILYDLGDFLDDYAVHPVLRNDLGLLWLADVDERGPIRLEVLPLKLEYCYTAPASGDDAGWIRRRLEELCADAGVQVSAGEGCLVVELR